MARLTALIWIDAYRMRLEVLGIPAFIVKRGDATAGAILVKLNTLDGKARLFQRITAMDGSRPWTDLQTAPESEIDAVIARHRDRDPDLWVIEVEDRQGRHHLDAPGLE